MFFTTDQNTLANVKMLNAYSELQAVEREATAQHAKIRITTDERGRFVVQAVNVHTEEVVARELGYTLRELDSTAEMLFADLATD